MKKFIAVNIAIFVVLAVAIASTIISAINLSVCTDFLLNFDNVIGFTVSNYLDASITANNIVVLMRVCLILSVIIALVAVAALIIINVFCRQYLIDGFNRTKINHATAAESRKKAAKQKRIEELHAELDELEKTNKTR